MKKLLLAAGLLFGGAAIVNAQNTDSTSTTTEQTTPTDQTTPTQDQPATQDQSVNYQNDQDKEGQKIEVSELPAPIQTTLQSNDYTGWVVTSARKKMWSDPDNAQAPAKEVYVVEAKNGTETKTLKFDKDGNKIEHKDKDQK